mmetsp:Transcript_16734/g.34462  ORF Transcript_16734/g.34462 Transcript_16734/m.34462 type:complete len:203 (-) Transcript_16734:178-786(-)
MNTNISLVRGNIFLQDCDVLVVLMHLEDPLKIQPIDEKSRPTICKMFTTYLRQQPPYLTKVSHTLSIVHRHRRVSAAKENGKSIHMEPTNPRMYSSSVNDAGTKIRSSCVPDPAAPISRPTASLSALSFSLQRSTKSGSSSHSRACFVRKLRIRVFTSILYHGSFFFPRLTRIHLKEPTSDPTGTLARNTLRARPQPAPSNS